MRSALKSFGSVLAGFVAASVVMTLVEFLNGHVLYPALGRAAEGVRDSEVLRRLMATAPRGALIVVIVGWALGGLTGGLVTGRLAPKRPAVHGLVLALVLTVLGVVNDLMIPPPLWFWSAGLALLGPMAIQGARLAPRKD